MRKIFTCAFVLLSLCSYAQLSEPLVTGHYIVIAAYRPVHEVLAKKYADRLNQSGAHARYGYDTPHHYVYVYLDYYPDFHESIREMLKTRKENGFEQAWVRVITASSSQPGIAAPSQWQAEQNGKSELSTMQSGATVVAVPPDEVITAQPKPSALLVSPLTVVSSQDASPYQASPSGITEVKEPVEVKGIEPVNEKNAKVPFSVTSTKIMMRFINPTDNTIVTGGEIEFVDTERSRLINTVKANEYVLLPDPKSTSGKLILIGSVFGYRKVQHELNYRQSPVDTTTLITPFEDSYAINFEMIRYRKGDTETLYDVFFYNDAAIMLPESKYQLNQLLQMMKDNTDYKIMLHGHTNGNRHGKIITMGTDKNFFALSDDVKEGVGSAKTLSGKRAEVIREWLIANGISADRIQAKAWGGTKMLHDKNSVNAKKNVRVEVEVLED